MNDKAFRLLHRLVDRMEEALQYFLTIDGIEAIDDCDDIRSEYERWFGPDSLTARYDVVAQWAKS